VRGKPEGFLKLTDVLALPQLYCSKCQINFKACLIGEVSALRLIEKLLFESVLS